MQWPREKRDRFRVEEVKKSALRVPDKRDDLQTYFARWQILNIPYLCSVGDCLVNKGGGLSFMKT